MKDMIILDDLSVSRPPYNAPCFGCRHMTSVGRCAAFPDRIPDAIWNGDHDHKTPFVGDHGIQFQPGTPSAMPENQT